MQQLSRQHEVLLRLFLDQERRSHAFDRDARILHPVFVGPDLPGF